MQAAAAAKAAQQSMQKPLEEVFTDGAGLLNSVVSWMQDPPLDEAWIAAMERQEEKEKEAIAIINSIDMLEAVHLHRASPKVLVAVQANRERAAAQRRERTHAARARPGIDGSHRRRSRMEAPNPNTKVCFWWHNLYNGIAGIRLKLTILDHSHP